MSLHLTPTRKVRSKQRRRITVKGPITGMLKRMWKEIMFDLFGLDDNLDGEGEIYICDPSK
jgi:hypothetical protein